MTLSREELLWLELALTPEVQPHHLPPLLAAFGGVEGVFAAGLMELGAAGVSAGAAAGINNRAGREAAEAEAERMRCGGISLVAYSSPGYPPLLRRVPDPPPALFALGGTAEADEAAVAVVGSRDASAYGAQVAHRLAGDLAARGVTVVSGMARGIDQSAHHGALEAGGRTLAVIGSGFGEVYPPRSEKLVERIAASGAVLTEFPYDVPPSKKTFPQRNRIISGICCATLVVEASERSGALITARFALDQDRELLAVPGPITARRSVGTNYMIKRGAKLVQRVEDVVEELPVKIRERLRAAAPGVPPVELSERERAVLDCLSVDKPLHVDIIARQLGLATPDLSLVLLGLEMKSLARQLPGMEYVRAI